MKRIALKIALLLAASLISALPALAAEGMGNSMMGQQGQNMKDECLLMARNCGDRVDTIQQRIDRINHEIGKGTAVYSRQELMHLNSQLEDANRTLELLMSGGA
jgi:TolA-binding protein